MAKGIDKVYMQNLADAYAERYGIIDYKVNGTNMIYIVSYPQYLSNPAYSVKFTVDLLTGASKSEPMSRFYKKGLYNRR